MDIPDEVYKWAEEQVLSTRQGVQSFLRNLLIGCMRRDRPSQPETAVRNSGRGLGVHQDCYNTMLDDYEQRKPDQPIPTATPWEAERTTICPECRRVINPGDQIIITNPADWI